MTEPGLVERCRRGDREAQHELYTRTSERIYRVALRITRDADAAFDVAQETYVRAFTRLGQFDGRSDVVTWLYRVAVNESLQFLRRAKRTRPSPETVAPGTTRDVEQDVAILRIDMDEALAGLSPADRAILLLRYQEGLDYQAISEVLGYPLGTVASRLNRARERVRARLKKDYGVEEEPAATTHPME
jgi:RNA polymerase sigma-70 factor, ECF subfamily